jgi:hypothetical protein
MIRGSAGHGGGSGMGHEEDEDEDEEALLEDLAEVEREKERVRLVEAVKAHVRQRERAPSEPAELLEAVRAVLRGKVRALEEDEWMFEGEEEGEIMR